ncbi:MAG: hypothetical protein J6Q53_00200 [Oscillospiraceae bacterium]|nr:hypothetical protein [Oscillospiraceae bacterium]
MHHCNSCSGSCGSCSGCARELVLTEEEIATLRKLAQIPFLPIAKKANDTTPVFLEDTDYPTDRYSLILACLEKKGLIDLDYRQSLSGFDYRAYEGFPVHGSMALTARGQTVAEMLELQGITESE